MGDRTADDLRAEAEYLARRAFGVALRASDAVRYADANLVLGLGDGAGDGAQERLLRQAMTRHADVEALEFALRLSNRRNVVTRKLHVLAFLIESDPRYAPRFLNDTPSRARAYAALAAHALRAVWKYAVGRRLRRRLAATHA
jgi:hypothetical protein